MGFDGLRRAEPQKLRPKTAHGANIWGEGGSHIKEVEINEDSLISVLKLTLNQKKKHNQGIQKYIYKDFLACLVLAVAVWARPPELVMGTNKPR